MSPLDSVTLQLNGIDRTFYYRSESEGDRGVIQQIFGDQDYRLDKFAQNPSVLSYYERLMRAGKSPLIIDAGANIGASVVYFCTVYPDCHLVAIEPEPNNCSLLKQNCNGFDYTLLEGGIGSENDTLFLEDPGLGDWGFRVSRQGQTPVPVYCAREIVERYATPDCRPFILKIDIEGGEENLFRGNTDWVSAFPVIVIELHDWLFPHAANSRNFLRAIAAGNYDFVNRGENVFCFNNDLLS